MTWARLYPAPHIRSRSASWLTVLSRIPLRYAECAAANTAAAALPLVAQPYPEHNLESLAWCARNTGDRRAAQDASAQLAERARVGILVSSTSADMNPFERYLVAPTLTALYFGDWRAAIASVPQEPSARLAYARAIWWFAKGMAAAQSHLAEAESGASAFYYLMALQRVSNDLSQRAYERRLVLMVAICVHRLRGAIALVSAGSHPDGVSVAIDELKRAVQVQDAMGYDEPRAWYESSRPALALALVAKAAASRRGDVAGGEREGRHAQQWQTVPAAMPLLPADALAPALGVLREDLRRFPANPQALHVCAGLGVPGCATVAANVPTPTEEHATPIRTDISSAPPSPNSLVVEVAPADINHRRRIPIVDAGARTATLITVVCAAMFFLLLLVLAAASRRKRVGESAAATIVARLV